MSELTDTQTSNGNGDASRLLTVDPYRSLRASFGMLLGVNDIETIDAYHRGKMWLHNAWLHGSGVVWGFKAELHVDDGEIRVSPGLAVDPQGRELHLDQDLCVNVARWFEEYQGDDLDVRQPDDNENISEFDVHVIARFKGCLTRPVPALSEPCEGAQSVTSYSRIFETVELQLIPGKAPDHFGPHPYHRLRLLFGIDSPIEPDGVVVDSDQQVLDRLETIDSPTTMLDAFRDFAALDSLDLKPATSGDGELTAIFPSSDVDVVLADVTNIQLVKIDGHWKLAGANPADPDNTVRRTVVATATIQELLCGGRSTFEPTEGGVAPDPPDGGESDPAAPPDAGERRRSTNLRDAGGPRIDPAGVRFDQSLKVITFEFDEEALTNSVKEPAISIFSFGTTEGWRREKITIDFDRVPNRVTVTVDNDELDRQDTLRLIVRGTGEAPVIGGGGGRRVPFAGTADGPPGTQHNGHDFYQMFKLVD